MDEIKALFETNLFGTIRVMKAVLPIMRKQHSGIIVNITSMGGRIGLPFGTAYHGTKFAFEGISESIRYEIEPFGIKVILIEPGVIRTNFASNYRIGQKAADPHSPYLWILQAMQKAFQRYLGQKLTPPEEVANVILKAVTSENPDIRFVVGNDAMQLVEAKKRMSDLEFEAFIKQQFFSSQ